MKKLLLCSFFALATFFAHAQTNPINNLILQNGGTNVTGLVVANGSSAATTIAASALSSIASNINKISVLQWTGSLATQTVTTGTKPHNCCFDGTNIWVSDNGTSINTVIKINATTGSVVGTYSVGVSPGALCFDGTNIWVLNGTDGTVTKLTAATGAVVGTYTMGTSPSGICWDGTNIWVTLSSNPATLLQVNDSTGAITNTYTSGFGDNTSGGRICFDGTNLWLAQYTAGSVAQVNTSGTVLATITVGSHCRGICYDGNNIWVCNVASNTVSKINTVSGTVIGTFTVGTSPIECCFDGKNVWVTANVAAGNPGLYKLEADTGRILGDYILGTAAFGVCFDGSNVWACNNNNAGGVGTVSRVSTFTPMGPGNNTVVSVSSGSASTLFGTSVSNSTTTPSISYNMSSAAANSLWGNNTGSTTQPAYHTLTSYFDSSFGSAQGDILYRSAGAGPWTVLVPGTSGQWLITQGASANPIWTNTLTTPTVVGAVTFPAGTDQIFVPNGTVSGFNFGSVSSDPSTPINGDEWYNSTEKSYNGYANGASVSFPYVLFDHFADAGNTSTTETDLYSDSVLGNQIVTPGASLQAQYGITIVASATATREVRVYFGGTVIYDSGADAFVSTGEITLDVFIIADSSTSIRYRVVPVADAGTSVVSTQPAVGKLTGLTLSSANILKITGQSAGTGAATNDIVAILGKVEFKPPQ